MSKRKLKPVNYEKRYKNKSEDEFAKHARLLGWEVTKTGYPDFICYKPNGDIVLVEIKPNTKQRLKLGQQRFMNTISSKGIACYRWSPDKNWLDFS